MASTSSSSSSSSSHPARLPTVEPVFQVSWLTITNPNIDFFKYFSFWLQELDIRLTEPFVNSLLRFFEVLDSPSNKLHNKQLLVNYAVLAPEPSALFHTTYFETVLLNPVRINVSFLPQRETVEERKSAALKEVERASNFLSENTDTPSNSSPSTTDQHTVDLQELGNNMTMPNNVQMHGGSKYALPKMQSPMRELVGSIGVALLQIDQAPITLNAFYTTHLFSTRGELVERVGAHYQSQVIRQMYKILGSSELLGNPVSLVNNLGSGVKDFFYEPAHGIISSPRDFITGTGRGTSSLIKHSLGGLFETTGKITGAIGKGMAHLSMDDDYRRSRRSAAQETPKHMGDGLAKGVMGLGKGIYQGLTGIVTDPIKGSKGGVVGTFKGVGTGLVGVVVKPTVGVFDLAAKTSQGIRNTSLSSNTSMLQRVRMPRYIGFDRCLSQYNSALAYAQFVLIRLRDPRGRIAFRDQWYLFHAPLLNDQLIFVTNEFLIQVNTTSLANNRRIGIEWFVKLHTITKITNKRPTRHVSSASSVASSSSNPTSFLSKDTSSKYFIVIHHPPQENLDSTDKASDSSNDGGEKKSDATSDGHGEKKKSSETTIDGDDGAKKKVKTIKKQFAKTNKSSSKNLQKTMHFPNAQISSWVFKNLTKVITDAQRINENGMKHSRILQ